jgi:tripartite-type tricarboxylate transporter receptor subunit TctC
MPSRINSPMSRAKRTLVKRVALALASSVLISAAPAALAQPYPTKPIKIVVPFAPGGATDYLARVVAENLTTSLGQPVLVDNKPGAAINLGSDFVAKSAPDGYTVLMATLAIAVNPALFTNMPYNWEKDLKPVTMVGFVPNLLVVNPSLPVKSVHELIVYAKANPGKLNFGSAGNGGAVHLSGELFKIMAKVDMQHVPYKGSAPAVTDLIGGQLALMFDNLPSVYPHVQAGKLRGIAVTSAARSAAAPEFPTIAESGLPGYEVLPWNGIFVPAGTPEAVVTTLNEAIAKALKQPALKANLLSKGIEPGGNTPEEFNTFVKAEAKKWQGLVKQAGITAM